MTRFSSGNETDPSAPRRYTTFPSAFNAIMGNHRKSLFDVFHADGSEEESESNSDADPAFFPSDSDTDSDKEDPGPSRSKSRSSSTDIDHNKSKKAKKRQINKKSSSRPKRPKRNAAEVEIDGEIFRAEGSEDESDDPNQDSSSVMNSASDRGMADWSQCLDGFPNQLPFTG